MNGHPFGGFAVTSTPLEQARRRYVAELARCRLLEEPGCTLGPLVVCENGRSYRIRLEVEEISE